MKFYILVFCILFSTIKTFGCSRTIVQFDTFTPSAIQFDDTTTGQTISFTVTHNAPTTACLYFIAFDYGTATTFTDRALNLGTNSIPYNVFSTTTPSPANILRDQQDVTAIAQIVFFPIFSPAAGSTTNSHTLFAQIGAIPPGLPPGVYTSSLVAKLVAATGAAGPLATFPVADERALTFFHVVESNLNISLVPTGGAFAEDSTVQVFNFDRLTTGEVQTADIRIQTNVGYRLFVNSANAGRLRHITAPAEFVDYTLSVNGSAIPLTGGGPGAAIETNNGAFLAGSEETIPLSVTIGSVTTQPAGAYQDIISFTIEAF